MRAGRIRSGYAKVSNSRARNCGFEKDVNRTSGTGCEALAAVIFLRKVDAGSDDLLYDEIGFRPIRECEWMWRVFRIDGGFAEIDSGGRYLESGLSCLAGDLAQKRDGHDADDCPSNLLEVQGLLPSGGLMPKIAVPTRMQVEPSSIAISKSCDMPIESTSMRTPGKFWLEICSNRARILRK